MKPIFMIDIETTSVDIFEAEVLQVGILALEPAGDIWRPRATLEISGLTDLKPCRPFDSLHLAHLYTTANNHAAGLSDEQLLEQIAERRRSILGFLKDWGARDGDARFIGHRAGQFDLPILHNNGYLVAPGYTTLEGREVKTGDHDYRTIEIAGALDLVAYARGWRHDATKAAAMALCPEVDLPNDRREHDAIYDCFAQTKLWNGLLRLIG